MDEKEEIWENIPGFDGYMVSSLGNVRSFRNGRKIDMKIRMNGDGYVITAMTNNDGVRKSLNVHRLVLQAFSPHENSEKLTVDHIDRNKTNNNLGNLRWLTNRENNQNKIFASGSPILKIDKDTGEVLERFLDYKIAATSMNCSTSTIQHATRNVNPVKGFIWKKEKERPEITTDTEFKEIEKYPGYYVSKDGCVRGPMGKILQPCIKQGYYHVNMRQHITYIHRLVAIHFVDGRTDEKHVVNHIDENKLNNHAANLEWVTIQENTIHSIYKQYKKVKQVDPFTNKVVGIYNSVKEVNEAMGTPISISDIKNGIRSIAAGFIWIWDGEDVKEEELPRLDFHWYKCIQKIRLETGAVLETFDTITAAATSVNVKHRNHIRAAACGRRSEAHGFGWKFVR